RCPLTAGGGSVGGCTVGSSTRRPSSREPDRERKRWSRRYSKDCGRRGKTCGRSETGDSGTRRSGKDSAKDPAGREARGDARARRDLGQGFELAHARDG